MTNRSHDEETQALIRQVCEIASDAMLAAYMESRNPQRKILPDWNRVVREKYEGSVYAEKESASVEMPRESIDPHAWGGMKGGVFGTIDNALTYKTEMPDYLKEYAEFLENEKRLKPKQSFKISIMLAGIKAATEAISNLELGVTPPIERG